jgi:hypothetical protein
MLLHPAIEGAWLDQQQLPARNDLHERLHEALEVGNAHPQRSCCLGPCQQPPRHRFDRAIPRSPRHAGDLVQRPPSAGPPRATQPDPRERWPSGQGPPPTRAAADAAVRAARRSGCSQPRAPFHIASGSASRYGVSHPEPRPSLWFSGDSIAEPAIADEPRLSDDGQSAIGVLHRQISVERSAARTRATCQLPKTPVTTLAAGQSPSLSRWTASPPRRVACVRDQS